MAFIEPLVPGRSSSRWRSPAQSSVRAGHPRASLSASQQPSRTDLCSPAAKIQEAVLVGTESGRPIGILEVSDGRRPPWRKA